MGFLEKLKNTFFEEEYVEIEEKPKVHKEVKKEPKREARVTDVKNQEEKSRVAIKKEEVREVIPEKRKVVVENSNFPKEEVMGQPVVETEIKKTKNFDYFDEDDFLGYQEEEYIPPRVSSKPVVKKEVEPEKQPKLYDNPSYASKVSVSPNKSGPYSKQVKSGFQPTPIISPIYGILDKNYTKEEIVEKKETKPSSYVSRKNADLDSVREKAFGSLMSDFDLTTNEKMPDTIEEVPEEEFEVEENLLYDMTNDCKTPTVDKVTLQDAEEYFQDLGLEYNIDYKDAKLERATGRRVSKTPKIDEIEEEEIQEEVVSNGQKREENNNSLEDNLFDLIDSMYEEKE